MNVTQPPIKSGKWFDVPYAYTRTIDGMTEQMIEIEPSCYVNAAAAIALGLIRDQSRAAA